MVDFQSRDTRRDVDDGDDDSDSEPTDDSDGEANDESTGESESADGAPGDAQPAGDATGDHDSDPEDDQGQDRESGDSHAHGAGQEHESGGDHGHSHDQHAGGDHDHGHGLDVDLLGVAVVTISSSRSLDDDPSGDVIQAVVEGDDHEVVTRELLRDDFDSIQSTVKTLAGREDVDVVITTGGTGVTPDDVTIEAVRGLFGKTLPGFGELFRLLSYDEIGTMVVATRATAGIVDGVPVFCLPGSEDAAHLGTEEIVLPEMEHLAGLAAREG